MEQDGEMMMRNSNLTPVEKYVTVSVQIYINTVADISPFNYIIHQI